MAAVVAIKNMVELHQMIINGWEKSPMGVGQCLNMSQRATVQTRKQHVGPRAHLGGNAAMSDETLLALASRANKCLLLCGSPLFRHGSAPGLVGDHHAFILLSTLHETKILFAEVKAYLQRSKLICRGQMLICRGHNLGYANKDFSFWFWV